MSNILRARGKHHVYCHLVAFETILFIAHDLQSVMTYNKFIANAHSYLNSCWVALLIMIDFCEVHLKHCVSGLMNLPNMVIIERSLKCSRFAESDEPW